MLRKKYNRDSFVIWEGNSLLNGEKIVLILSTKTANAKTGSMLQTWILPAEKPILDKDSDLAVCGNCPLRDNGCYVVKVHSPNQIQKPYLAGRYMTPSPVKLAGILDGEKLRAGSYGDPTAVPFEVWESLFKQTVSSVGYTHQWRTCDPRWKDYLQASVETPEQAIEAQNLGWKTFRVKKPNEAFMAGEIQCRNEKNDEVTCKLCGLCNGKSFNIALDVHGSRASAYFRLREEVK